MNENDKQAKPVAMKYYDEHGNDKLEGLLINNSKHVSTISFFDKADTEVLRIEQDGDVIWKGRKVESDAEFKAAMIDLANVMKGNIHPAQPVQPAVAQGEPVGEVRQQISQSNTFVQWYKQPKVGEKLYTAPPAAAINEQLLEALKDSDSWLTRNHEIIPHGLVHIRIKAAIVAAEAEKAKGGV